MLKQANNTIAKLTASMMAVFLWNTSQAQDVLTGDTRLACEAILCLSSGVRPGECAPSLARYFGINHKRWSDTVRDRINFLNLCPSGNEIGMPELINAIGHGAGRCDAAYLNRYNTYTKQYRVCTKDGWGRDDVSCHIETETHVSDKLPKYCGIYQNHEWTYQVGVKYIGKPTSGGRWVDAQDYEQELQKYNDLQQRNAVKRSSRFSRTTREEIKTEREYGN